MTMRFPARARAAALGLAFAGAMPAHAQSDADALSQGLVRLRGSSSMAAAQGRASKFGDSMRAAP